MEGLAQRICRLAYDLCPGKQVCKKRGFPTGIHSTTTDGRYPRQSQCGQSGFHQYKSASGWDGGFEKRGPQSIGRSCSEWNTKLHMVAASDRDAVMFTLSLGQAGDTPGGRALLRQLGPVAQATYLLMDRAYEGDETRGLAVKLGYVPVVPPKRNRKKP